MRPFCLLALVSSLLCTPTLANDDARVGTVVDRQGTALVRPVGRDRWTPVGPKSILMPGDLVRTPVRGANAVEVRLAGKGRLVVGPGSLVEIKAADSVKLLRGDMETTGVKSVDLPSFLGPNNKPIDTMKTLVFRSDGKKTQLLSSPPRWLTGYRNSTTDEWMGSLVAQVDGRDVPLSVGYHKVNVDIRDQIARTTIEQSFVNSTRNTLEGVFYFPLPADASISGFGMWIGNELVEADIVEKQRARAIYEDILRQRKDPGLLEWSGGNLFKARVFPIFPHSEKRIRIQYTQVLPLEGSTVRYRYALRSELLRARPLRQLQLKVSVSSTTPIVSVACPSHPVRTRKTDHAASVEFDAEEYSPERDFELRIGLDRSQPLVVVPHRRADDGYFMLLLAPPDAGGAAWQRELMPEAEPLDVILVADTSGSMDRLARASQAAFIQAMLSLLGTKDKFRLLTCDVQAQWFNEESLAVTEENAAAALSWLDRRASLGWTDLDLAFGEAGKVATERSLLIYVGDGIGTTGNADPVELAERIRNLGKGVCHAIHVSSTYEQGVLEAIASIGGGSVRNGADNPVEAAYGLLAEAAQPAVKNLKISFEGLRTARVYPERLPNLAAGAQQIVLGRFLPTKGDQTGTVTISGTLDGKPVRYATKLTIKADEAGNSFLPRLWARKHLDVLLAQGDTAAVKQEIVAFSEEYGIMTPYTSFLVLESDAQREQYGVTRRVRMRDGERFFAQGRDQASTELLQQQMKLARSWRLRLRAAMLREIATLGRHLHLAAAGWQDSSVSLGIGGGRGGAGGSPARSMRAASERARSVERLNHTAADSLEEGLDDEGIDGDGAIDAPGEESFEEHADREEPSPAQSKKMESRSFDKRRKGSRRPPGVRTPSDPSRDWRGRRENLYRQLPTPTHLYLFPPLPAPPTEPGAVPEPKWPEGVLERMRSLRSRDALAALPGGIRIRQDGEVVHAVNGRSLATNYNAGLYGHGGWFFRGRYEHGPVFDRWLAAGRVGVLNVGLRLGRERDAAPADRRAWPYPLLHQQLVRSYASYSAELKDGVIILRAPAPGTQEIHLRIDAAKRVMTELAVFVDGKKSQTTRWSDFVEVGGIWWAQRWEHFDAKDRVTHRTKLTVEGLDAAAFTKALAAATAGHEDAIMLTATDPTIEEAKQAAHDSNAGFADYLMLAMHFATTQQWDRVFANWERAQALVPNKPGALWLRAELLIQGRRGAEAQKLLHQLTPPPPGPAQSHVATHALGLAQRIFQHNEMAELVERVKPALPEVTYLRMLAQWLHNAGQPDRALAIRAELAAKRPFDLSDVVNYVNALQRAQRTDEAIALVTTSIGNGGWMLPELDQLYSRWTDLVWQRRDIKELHRVTLLWMKLETEYETAYQRYISTLVFLDREKEADSWVKAQLAGATGPAMNAAINYALGQGWHFYTNRVEEKWWQPLGELGLRLVRGTDKDWNYATRILGNGNFMGTDAGLALRASMRTDVTAQGAIETMALPRLVRMLARLHWTPAAVDDATWRDVVDRLNARWKSAPVDHTRETLAQQILHVLDNRAAAQEAIDFLRSGEPTPALARTISARLLTLDWTAEIEAELFAWLQRMQPKKAEDNRRIQVAGAEVRGLTEQLEKKRYKALLGPVKELEKLTRAERRLKQRKTRVDARNALAAALAVEAQRADQWSAPWMQLERLCLQAQTGTGDVNGNARELLGSAKDRVLKERCAYVLAYIATRRKAPDGLADAVIKFLEAQKGEGIDWRTHLFRLLVALNRDTQLTATLEGWISPTSAESRWRVALGYLHAESGRLKEAAAEFDAVARADELSAAEYEALANWLLVLDRKQQRELALFRRYLVMAEYQLQQRVYQEYYKVSRNRSGTPPADFDPDVLRALRALLTKTSYPANYAHLARSLYQSNKDFRVLECLPYGAIGHTPQGVYPFLQQVTSILAQVHEEATCDSMTARIHELQASAKSDLDRRALLLLLASTERRASEVLNAPGPHAEKGTTAMKQAFLGAWLDGERRLMASWLASLGKIPHEAFAKLQRSQLLELSRTEPKPLDRLWICQFLAQTQWRYGKKKLAIDTLSVALDEYKRTRGGLRNEANAAFTTLINWLKSSNRHGDAETRIEAELKAAVARPQRMWLQQQIFAVYVHALQRGSSVSYGRGRALYDAVRKRIEAALWGDGPDQMRSNLSSYCLLHRAAKESRAVPEAGNDLEQFATTKLSELLTLAMADRNSLVQTVADQLHHLRGPRVALELLIVQMEREPSWLKKVGRDGWTNHSWRLARWRAEVGDLGDLTQRLLKFATQALEENLLLTRSRRNSMMQIKSGYFWRSQAGAFKAVALKVIELNPESVARQVRAATYLWSGLHEFDSAIGALLAAEARGNLHEQGRFRLVQWLAKRKRWPESLPLIDKLLVQQPDNLAYRLVQIRALHYSKRSEQAGTRLDAALARFKELKQWNEGVLAGLARVARECAFHTRSVRLYEELIPLVQRTHANRGVGGGSLSTYYGELSSSYLALEQVDKAVDAASAAVVAWGRTHRNRATAIAALMNVLNNLRDLDGYAKRYEARVTQSGLDAPLIRKGMGAAYLNRRQPALAVPHYLAARDLQPNDNEIHQQLLKAYDALGDEEKAIAALLDGIAMAPLNLELYADLGARLEKRGETGAAERAWTTLVEVLPNEAASHRRLAQYRASRGDHKAAVEQWRQVVRVRTDEPDGWLQLAGAQVADKDNDGARETLRRIMATKWVDRNVYKKAEALLRQLG